MVVVTYGSIHSIPLKIIRFRSVVTLMGSLLVKNLVALSAYQNMEEALRLVRKTIVVMETIAVMHESISSITQMMRGLKLVMMWTDNLTVMKVVSLLAYQRMAEL